MAAPSPSIASVLQLKHLQSMPHTKHRVSYVIPPPIQPAPRLRFPPPGTARVGAIAPNIIPDTLAAPQDRASPPRAPNLRHRLGVSALALDTSTQLANRASPEGILYTVGRDGMVVAWDLGIPMKKRKLDLDRDGITGRKTSRGRWEHQWEIDPAGQKPGTQSKFRESVQANDDWLNDILLCNHNQTVISASSDGTVKAWNPHSTTQEDPSTIGTHEDYVRCLARAHHCNWVASGSFDRRIRLWDLTRDNQRDTLVTLTPPDAAGPKSSIYALAADPFGRTIASGSPERVVRLWDPRTGRGMGKLVGHTDNIRTLLISEDSRYLLTGSADASVKLWSLSAQRCIHTFTHHMVSVRSLFSSHLSLQTFYSGDRSGLVCRVDVENCSDLSEGECIVLCHDTEQGSTLLDGINKMAVMDDHFLWTASNRSSIKRWVVPPTRSVRIPPTDVAESRTRPRTALLVSFMFGDEDILSAENTKLSQRHRSKPSLSTSISSFSSERAPSRTGINSKTDDMLNGLPFHSLVRLSSPNVLYASHPLSAARDVEVATIYSAASVMPVPRNLTTRPSAAALNRNNTTVNATRNAQLDNAASLQRTPRAEYEERELAGNATPLFP